MLCAVCCGVWCGVVWCCVVLCGGWRRAVLGQGCRRARGLGLDVVAVRGAVQLLDKVADVPVAVPQLLFL